MGAKIDSLIGLLMIFGPWAVGGFLGCRFGRTRWGLAGVIAVGLLVTGLGLLGFFLTADPWASSDCRECSEYLGRALDYTLVEEWPVYTAAAWSFAAGVGGLVGSDPERARRTSG